MPFDEIVYFSGDDLEAFMAVLVNFTPRAIYEARFVIDEGGLKMKFNNGPWTYAMGRVVKH